MSERLKVGILRTAALGALGSGGVLRLEVGGVVLGDRVMLFGGVGVSGSGDLSAAAWFGRSGSAAGLGPRLEPRGSVGSGGLSIFGGYYFEGVEVAEVLTQGVYGAGDYGVRVSAQDGAGNWGPWSALVVVRHRPRPLPVSGLGLDAGSGVVEWD